MKTRILLLGSTGKMGLALSKLCPDGFSLTGLSSRDFDAADPDSLLPHLERLRPDVILNAVGYLGIDPCEQAPAAAFAVNTVFPYRLAQMANDLHALLVHFSTDAVFHGDQDNQSYNEDDLPSPVNLYGLSKFGGDCMVKNTAEQYYIVRISTLFGPSRKPDQFVEKMLGKIRAGEKRLKIADDILCSPCFSEDVARATYDLIDSGRSSGVYHLANQGTTSLFGLMQAVVEEIGAEVTIEPASYRDFPFVGRKNLRTPLASRKVPALRPWRDALSQYLRER